MYYEKQTVEAHGAPTTEYRTEPDVTEDPDPRYDGARVINAAERPSKGNRFLVTLVHRTTGQEELVDIVIDGDRFVDMAIEVRHFYGHEWEIFEWFDPNVPF